MTEAGTASDKMWQGVGDSDKQHNYGSLRDEKEQLEVVM